MSVLILLSMSFSKTLEITDRRLIGRYDDTSVRFLPGLGNSMIFACFKDAGQEFSLSMALSTYSRFSAKRSAFCLSLLAHGPGGVEHLRFGGIDVCGFSPVFDWFPDRVIISFKGGNVCSKGCIPHVTERRFEVATCLVI